MTVGSKNNGSHASFNERKPYPSKPDDTVFLCGEFNLDQIKLDRLI